MSRLSENGSPVLFYPEGGPAVTAPPSDRCARCGHRHVGDLPECWAGMGPDVCHCPAFVPPSERR